MTNAELPIAPGQIVAERYLVGEVLGGGGMGVVLAGTHVLLGTPVAIKLIHSELRDDPEAVQRFVNEARATAALKGEHIARVFDVGLLPTGEPYLVMERLEGVGLDDYLQGRGPLSVAETTAIALQVCEGLAEAHAAALVHRDIKPANLFLTQRVDGQMSVKILDFGIAKHRVQTQSLGLTDPGKSLGSPWYMSPEQMLTPASVDERADVWSIGVLLFELLTARVPFDGESVPQVCANVLGAPAPRPSEFCASIPPELDSIVLRCLEKSPEARYGNVGELAQALSLFVPVPAFTPAPAASSAVPLEEAPKLRTSRTRAWPRALSLVVLLALLFGGWLQYRDPTLLYRVLSGARLELSARPTSAPASGAMAREIETGAASLRLLQVVHTGRAFSERANIDAEENGEVVRGSRARLRRTPATKPRDSAPAASWERLTEDHYGL